MWRIWMCPFDGMRCYENHECTLGGMLSSFRHCSDHGSTWRMKIWEAQFLGSALFRHPKAGYI